MASLNLFYSFVEKLAEGVFDFENDQIVVALTNTEPDLTGQEIANITEISYTNLTTRNLTTSSSSQTSGTYSFVVNDHILSGNGGSVGPFQYIVLYDDTATNDPMIGYYDYGSAATLNAGETLTLDFSTTGVFSIT